MSGVGAALDAEFLFLLTLLRTVFATLQPEHRDQARLWLERLCWVPAVGDSARRDRNEYLSRLYACMLANKLDGVFLEEPPEGFLRPASEVFPPVDLQSWLEPGALDQEDAATVDADERTYLATQVLPGGDGAFGYLAVSMAKGEPHWIRPSARPSPSRGPAPISARRPTPRPSPRADPSPTQGKWRREDPQAASTPVALDTTSLRGDSSIEDLMDRRPPPEERSKLLSLYDSLIRDLDLAVLSDSGAASAGLDKFLEAPPGTPTSTNGDVSVNRKELLSQLRSRLTARRERVARRSEFLDSLEQDLRTTVSDESHLPKGDADQVRDQDDVWNIKSENMALLEAAYPLSLVRRFLDGIVRERVALLGRVRARRYCQNHVEGVEEDAAEDMGHYVDASTAWAGILRCPAGITQAEACTLEVENVVRQVERAADLATRARDAIQELGAARRLYFEREEQLRTVQDNLRADIEMLRADAAAQKRRLERVRRGSSS